MAAAIQAVARQAQATFARSFVDDGFPECLSKLRRLMTQITCADVGLDDATLRYATRVSPHGATAPVTYISLFENVTFSMSIFIVKRGARIPLHDHPGMFGILKVLYGSASVSSYSVKQRKSTEATQSRSIMTVRPSTDKEVVLVEKHPDDRIGTESGICCLTPTARNIHEIRAEEEPVAFLDILAPPYDMKERDCHYYKVLQENRDNVLLHEIPPPRDFWCDSLQYQGPPISGGNVSGHY